MVHGWAVLALNDHGKLWSTIVPLKVVLMTMVETAKNMVNNEL